MEMKKTLFLSISVLLLSLFIYSCTKDDDDVPPRLYNIPTPECRTCGTERVPGSVRSS